MMNRGDLYELAKILGHSNIKMTEQYAKLGKEHIVGIGNTAGAMWRFDGRRSGERIENGKPDVPQGYNQRFWLSLSC